MRARDWIALVGISAVVAACCALGVSYVCGQGWPILDGFQTLALGIAAFLVSAVVLFLFDVLMRKAVVSADIADMADTADAAGETDTAGEADMADMPDSPAGVFTKRVPHEPKRPVDVSCEPGLSERLNIPAGPSATPSATPSITPSATSTTSSAKPSFLSGITPRWSAKSIIVFACVMAVFWLPWLIANFPGGTYWDTYYQMFQVYPENHPIAIIPWGDIYDETLTDAWLVDHHPVVTTMIYGAFGWVSDQLTGNWMAGVFAFVCLQGIAHVLTFTASVACMRKYGCPTIVCFIAYAYFCIMPFVSTWALCMVKDSLFGLFMVPYFMMLFVAVCTKGAYFTGKHGIRHIVLFVLCGLALCLAKKTGLFVVIPTAIIGAWMLRDTPAVAFALQGAVSVLIMLLIMPLVLFPILRIAPGGLQETLGPLFQQTARYAVDYHDEVTPYERFVISKVIDYNKLDDEYAFDFEDSVKYRYNLDSSMSDLMAYAQVYLAQGLKHPDAYFGAIMSLAGFYVAPTAYANIRMVTVDTKMGPDDRYMLWNPDELDWLREGMDEAYSAFAEIPVLNTPVLIVTYALWLPAMLLYCMWRRRLDRQRCGLLFVPWVVLLLFCVIAPVYDARYVVPIFNMVPLMVCAILALSRRDFNNYNVTCVKNVKVSAGGDS